MLTRFSPVKTADFDYELPASSIAQTPIEPREVIEILDGSERLIRFSEPIEPYFSKVGHVPLPPYIHEKLGDPERYQTVFAREPGSAAAPIYALPISFKSSGSDSRCGVK